MNSTRQSIEEENEPNEVESFVDENVSSDLVSPESSSISSRNSDENLLLSEILSLKFKLQQKEWASFSSTLKNELTALCTILGKSVCKQLFEDGLKVTSTSLSDLKLLQTLESKSWLREQNSLVIGFLSGCSGTANFDEESKKKLKLWLTPWNKFCICETCKS